MQQFLNPWNSHPNMAPESAIANISSFKVSITKDNHDITFKHWGRLIIYDSIIIPSYLKIFFDEIIYYLF